MRLDLDSYEIGKNVNLSDMVLSFSGFDWDKDNFSKNWEKHRVAFWECEEIFFNQPLLMAEDVKHSRQEDRFYALGKTDGDRRLFVVFTIRHKHLRVISARDMNQKERLEYKNAEKKDTRL